MVLTQDYALDSMENLLFSIARFKECVWATSSRRRMTLANYGLVRSGLWDTTLHEVRHLLPCHNFKILMTPSSSNGCWVWDEAPAVRGRAPRRVALAPVAVQVYRDRQRGGNL